MIKKIINVPPDIRYISDWTDFSQNIDEKDKKCIIDKKIPGCGFTEWVLTNNQDVILCSPRRILLQNKTDQHLGEVFLVINLFEEVVDYGKDLNRPAKGSSKIKVPSENDNKKKSEYFKLLSKQILNYIDLRHAGGFPAKILVTYDSFHLVKDILTFQNFELLPKFQVVVDEFQSLLVDSKFKATTELKFISDLQHINRVYYISATPMMENYLDQIDEFKDLPYYELDWNALQPGRVVKPNLKVRYASSIITSAKKIISDYKTGNFEKTYLYNETGSPVAIESKEAVIYVNSVNNICNIIKKCELLPEECNILCAKTPYNDKKISNKLGKVFKIGKVPLKGEPHKMFTFCTRTVYLGADFYSTNARSFILSDASIETLAVDISLDLPQILGRQRLSENPWKNSATFYYKPLAANKKITQDEFNNIIQKKYKDTLNLISGYDSAKSDEVRSTLMDKYKLIIETFNYKDDYLGLKVLIDKITAEKLYSPVVNNLVMLAEQRAFDMQQIDYADRFTVFNAINRNNINTDDEMKQISEFFTTYNSLPSFFEKLKFLCESNLSGVVLEQVLLQIKEPHFKEYYEVLGPKRMRELGYNITLFKKELNIVTFDKNKLYIEIYLNFKVGEKYTKPEIREKLSEIYNKVGYNAYPKATDLENYFNIKSISIYIKENNDLKKYNGFEILSVKK
jgi:hypothetical protein